MLPVRRAVGGTAPVRISGAGGGSARPQVTAAVGPTRGRRHQLVVVPVLAPVPIAWVAIGFVMDDRVIASEVLTSLHISFVGGAPAANGKSFEHAAAGVTQALLERPAAFTGPDELLPSPDGDIKRWRCRSLAMRACRAAVTAAPLSEAMQPFYRLQLILLALTALGVVISIVVSVLTARGIARAHPQLASFASVSSRRLLEERGGSGKGEIGELASAFNHMMEASPRAIPVAEHSAALEQKVEHALGAARRQGCAEGRQPDKSDSCHIHEIRTQMNGIPAGPSCCSIRAQRGAEPLRTERHQSARRCSTHHDILDFSKSKRASGARLGRRDVRETSKVAELLAAARTPRG